MEFRDQIKIDINRLDKAAVEQPSLYEEWSRSWAEAVLERDRSKEYLSAVKAEIDETIRKNPAKYGWDNENKSPTEAWIANQIARNADVRKATDEFIEAQFNVNILTTAKETLDHRKKSLEILTDLYKSNYFVARSRSDEVYEEALERSEKELREKTSDATTERLRRVKRHHE